MNKLGFSFVQKHLYEYIRIFVCVQKNYANIFGYSFESKIWNKYIRIFVWVKILTNATLWIKYRWKCWRPVESLRRLWKRTLTLCLNPVSKSLGLLLSLLSYNFGWLKCGNMRCANLYNSHAGADVDFPWTVRLHVLRIAEKRVPKKICFHFSKVDLLSVIGFKTYALGEQK